MRGLSDPEVKTVVLGEVEQKTDLEELVKLIQAKKYAKQSTSTSNTVSGLSKDKPCCGNCGKEHQKGRSNCPAQGKKCNKCDKMNHFASVCKSKPKPRKKASNAVENQDKSSTDSGDESNAVEGVEQFGYVFAFDQAERKAMKKMRQKSKKFLAQAFQEPIPHLVWESGKWKVKDNEKAPNVPIKYRLCHDGYQAAGRKLPKGRISDDSRPFTATCTALADTGCTTMVAGLSFMKNLGLERKDLCLW